MGRTPYENVAFEGFLDTRPGLAPKWTKMERTSYDKVVYAGFWDTVPGYRKTSTGQFGTNFEGFWDTVTPYWDAEKLLPGPMSQNGVNTLRFLFF